MTLDVRCSVIVAATAALISISAAAAPPVKDTTPEEKLIDVVDAVMQERFQTNMPQVGKGRLVIPMQDHIASYKPATFTADQQAAMKKALDMNVEYVVGFLGVTHAMGTPGSKQGSTSSTSELVALPAQFRKNHDLSASTAFKAATRVAKSAFPQVSNGQAYSVRNHNELIVLRPIQIKKQACLNCHRGAKQGDTLGVMAYIAAVKHK